jgi:peptidyl-prolyl cis-trans isomerase D
MLSTLRNAAGTWVAKILLLLLVASFAVWGVAGRMESGLGGNTVVAAGGTTVSDLEYRLAYDRQLNALSQQFGQRLTREQATALGLDEQVVSQLVAGAVLDEQARLLKLGLSKERIAALTAEDTAFHGPDGKFDRQQFNYVLREIGMRPEDYFANRAQVAVRQQIVEAVSDGLQVPDTFLRALALYRGEDRTIEFLTLPKSLVEPIEAPTDAVLATWFEGQKANYAAPEYRKISYLKLEPADIADESAITDDAVQAEYEKNKGRYTTAETRTVEQLVFANQEEADAAAAALAAGATFDKLVTDAGKTPQDTLLGTVTKDRIPDKAVADAAFALALNQVSDVVAGTFGPVMLRVTAITPEVVRPFDAVKAELRTELALAEASQQLLDVHDKYEDARAGGETMAEAAGKLGLTVVTIDAIDRTGQRPDETIVADLPASVNLLNAAFETETDVENPGINIGSLGFVFFEVNGVTAARDRTLDEVRQKVITDWTAAETTRRLAERGADIEKRLKDGATLDAVATELSLEKQTKRGLKRAADDGDIGKDGVVAVFGVAQGGTGVIAGPDGNSRIVFKVTEVFEPAAADASTVPADEKNRFSTGLADDLLDELVSRLQGEYGVQIDRAAISRAHTL